MVSSLLSSVSSMEWLNKKIRWKKTVGVVAQSVEPLDPLKNKYWGLCVGSSPTDSNKKVPFFFLGIIIMQTGKPFRFHTPSSILVVGPSGCGKTVFTEKLLVESPELFETPPTQVHARSRGGVSRRDSRS